MRHQAIAALSTVFITGFCQPLVAQEPVRVVADGPGNRFYGQYEVVEDHADCAGPDRVAFRVPLIADALDYHIHDPAENAGALVSGGTIVMTDKQCFVTQGFGTNSKRVEVLCRSDGADAFRQRVEALEISVGLRGHVTACLSPMGVSFVDGDWAVTVTDADGEQVHRGDVDQFAAPQDGVDVEVYRSPSVAFSYLPDGFGRDAWPRASRDHPMVQSLDGVNGLRVEMSCVPVDGRDGAAPLLVGLRARIAIVDAPAQSCVGADCPETWPSGLSRWSDMGRTCALG